MADEPHTVTVHTSPVWRTPGATGEVSEGGTHLGDPSGDCRPAWLCGQRSPASVRPEPRYAAATVTSPGWRKGRRQTGWTKLHAGTSCQRWGTVLGKSAWILGRREERECCLGCYTRLIYPSCPDLPLPPCYLCPMSSLMFVSVKPWGQECPEIHRQAKDGSWSHPVWVLCIWCCSCHMFAFIIYEAGIDF